MKESIETIFSAPLANLLVVAGISFLFIAVVGTVAGKIDPGREGRIAAAAIGSILLIAGLSMHLAVGKRSEGEAAAPAQSVKTEGQVEEADRRLADERKQVQDAERKRAEERRQALEAERRQAEERKQAEERQRVLETERRQAEQTPSAHVNPCDPIVVPPEATCRDFYDERRNWSRDKMFRCGLYQVRRYKEVLNIRSDSDWSEFISPCR